MGPLMKPFSTSFIVAAKRLRSVSLSPELCTDSKRTPRLRLETFLRSSQKSCWPDETSEWILPISAVLLWGQNLSWCHQPNPSLHGQPRWAVSPRDRVSCLWALPLFWGWEMVSTLVPWWLALLIKRPTFGLLLRALWSPDGLFYPIGMLCWLWLLWETRSYVPLGGKDKLLQSKTLQVKNALLLWPAGL